MRRKHLGGGNDREVAGELTEPGGEIEGLVPGVRPVEVLRIVLPRPSSQPVEPPRSGAAAPEKPGPGMERGGERPPGRQRAGEGGGERGGIGHGEWRNARRSQTRQHGTAVGDRGRSIADKREFLVGAFLWWSWIPPPGAGRWCPRETARLGGGVFPLTKYKVLKGLKFMPKYKILV